MAKRRTGLKPDSTGQYYRQIGRKVGVKSQPKFRLGRDRTKAELAYHRLEPLWNVVVEQHQRLRSHHNYPAPARPPEEPPYWTDEALAVAEAIRKHQPCLRVGQPEHIHGEAAYAAYLEHMRQTYGHLTHIVPADPEAAEEGRRVHQYVAEHRSQQTRLAARIAAIPIPTGLVGSTLYQALIRHSTTTPSGPRSKRQRSPERSRPATP
ncbi:MAG: hypothetical protein ACLFV3_08105 [Phycisphaeraceae bacterium]